MVEREVKKKCSLRNEKLKANRASVTEEQRRERQTRASQSQFWEFETKCHLESLILPSSWQLKLTCDTRIIHLYCKAFGMDKKTPIHLEMRNLKQTELLRSLKNRVKKG